MKRRIVESFGRLALTALFVLGGATEAAMAAPVSGLGTWETTLKARDANGNAVAIDDPNAAFFYDVTLNITWLANMNANGLMDWWEATNWAGNLTTGGFDDWRLPTIVDSGPAGCDFSYDGGTDCGYNTQTQVNGVHSEWPHLYYITLGNLAYCAPGGNTPDTCEGPQANWGLRNTAHLQNMQSFDYWSSEYAPGAPNARSFVTTYGLSDVDGKTAVAYAAAVRAGDVLQIAGAVDEPGSLPLVLMALGLLARRYCGRVRGVELRLNRVRNCPVSSATNSGGQELPQRAP